MIRAPIDNAAKYLGSFLVACAAVWSILMFYGKENPWIDRVITGEIAVCGFFAAVVIIIYSPKFTARTMGVFGLMAAIVLIFASSQLLAAAVFGDPSPPPLPPGYDAPAMVPYWLRSAWRSILAVSGPCLLVGDFQWWHEDPKPPAL